MVVGQVSSLGLHQILVDKRSIKNLINKFEKAE